MAFVQLVLHVGRQRGLAPRHARVGRGERVREARRKPKPEPDAEQAALPAVSAMDDGELETLRQRVASLTAENRALRMELDALRARLGNASTQP